MEAETQAILTNTPYTLHFRMLCVMNIYLYYILLYQI
jgi:hypothetical protein